MARIAFVVTDFPALSETFIINQINAVIAEGYEVDVICLGRVNKDVRHQSVEKFNLMNRILKTKQLPANKVIRILSAVGIILQNLGSLRLMLTAFDLKKYRREAYDLQQFYRLNHGLKLLKRHYQAIHVHFGQNAVYLSNILKRINNTKVIVSFHGFDAHDFSAEFYKQLTNTDFHFTANTHYTADRMVKLGFKKDQISILPETLDTSKFSKPPSKPNNAVTQMIFVGRLVEWKAPHLVIEIIRSVIAAGYKVRCVIVGKGQLWDHCQQLINRYNLENIINMKGAQTQEQIMQLMSESDIFLYPGLVGEDGRCENQGLVIQEAQAMKLPVLVSDVGGMSEGVVNEKNGYLLQPNDIKSFTEKVIHLINNPELRKSMGELGRSFVVDKYDSYKVAKRLIEFYGNET